MWFRTSKVATESKEMTHSRENLRRSFEIVPSLPLNSSGSLHCSDTIGVKEV